MPTKLAASIARERSKRGWTQKCLADKVGVTRSTVSDWERGLSIPRMAHVKTLAQLLEIPQDQLLPFKDATGTQITTQVDGAWGTLADMEWATLQRLAHGESLSEVSTSSRLAEFPEKIEKPGDYRLTIEDDAMEPVYMIGDRIRIRASTAPFEGCQVVAWVSDNDGGTVVLRNWLLRRLNAFDLVAENPAFHTISCNKTRPGHVLGVVIRHLRVLSEPDRTI
jgi:transcriptional regulator with XRE-family HTH domain